MGTSKGNRKTIVIDGTTYCSDVIGAIPSLTLVNMTPGACVVDPPIDVEPPGRLLRATIDYPNIPGAGPRRNADMTKFEVVLGHATPSDAEQLWPGAPGAAIAISVLPAAGYIALAFRVTDARKYGTVGMATYGNAVSHQAIASVSERPGDFNPQTAVLVTPPRGPGETLLRIVGAPHTNGAQCVPGRLYYLNLRFASASTPHILALTNSVGVQP
jgi:hypothetical protein